MQDEDKDVGLLIELQLPTEKEICSKSDGLTNQPKESVQNMKLHNSFLLQAFLIQVGKVWSYLTMMS